MVETLERPQDIDGHCHCPEPDCRHGSDSEDLQLQDPSNDSAAAAAATVHCSSGSTQAGCTGTPWPSCPCSRWQIKQLHKACTARPVCKCEKCDFCLFCKYAIFSFFQVWATVQATSTSLTKQSSFMVDVMTQNMESR